MTTNIFVSHIHEEFPIALAVKVELKACFGDQVDVFLAEDISLGKNWFNQIQKALDRANLILGLFSHASRHRPWVNIEAGFGVMSGTPMIPLCCLGLPKADLPTVYGLYQGMERHTDRLGTLVCKVILQQAQILRTQQESKS